MDNPSKDIEAKISSMMAKIEHNALTISTGLTTAKQELKTEWQADLERSKNEMAEMSRRLDAQSRDNDARSATLSTLEKSMANIQAYNVKEAPPVVFSGSGASPGLNTKGPAIGAKEQPELVDEAMNEGMEASGSEQRHQPYLSGGQYSEDPYRPAGMETTRTPIAGWSGGFPQGLGAPGLVQEPTTDLRPPGAYPNSGSRPGQPRGPQERRPKAKLPEFDGTSRWKSFEARVEALAAQYCLNPTEQAVMLGECLKGKASDYYADLPLHVRMDYTQLKARLASMYGVRESPGHFQIKLATIQQGESTELIDFAQEVNHVARQAYPCDQVAAERAAAQHFLRGCCYKEAAKWALDKSPSSVEMALELVRCWLDREEIVMGKPVEHKSRSTAKKTAYDTTIRAIYDTHSPGRRHDPYRSQGHRPGSREDSRSRERTPERYRSRDGRPWSDKRERTPDRYRSTAEMDAKLDKIVRLMERMFTGKDDHQSKSSAGDRQPRSQAESRSPSPGGGRHTRRDSPTSSRVRGDSPGGRRSQGELTCFKCGSRDHLARECGKTSPKTVSFEDRSSGRRSPLN